MEFFIKNNNMEEWKKLPFENFSYWISNLGNVKSERRPLRIYLDKYGYYVAHLRINKKMKNFFVHRLVALAFIENPLNLPQVNHKDSNRANNKVENLEWIDTKGNRNHAIGKGRIKCKGEDNFNAKLTKEQIEEIRDIDRKTPRVGRSQTRQKGFLIFLSKKYNVGKSQIVKILSGKLWK